MALNLDDFEDEHLTREERRELYDWIRAEAVAEWRDKLAALAAIEEYICEFGESAVRDVREFLAGTGSDGNDPRVQARAWGLEWSADPSGVPAPTIGWREMAEVRTGKTSQTQEEKDL